MLHTTTLETSAWNIIGVGSALLGGAVDQGYNLVGAGLSSEFGLNAAEEFGDFTSDLLGTRGPVADDSTDSFYADGETDGWGQAINDWWNS